MKSTLISDFWEPIRDFIRSLMGSLPPATYGDPVPPELRLFEAQVDEARRHPREAAQVSPPHHAPSKPAKVGSGYKPQASE